MEAFHAAVDTVYDQVVAHLEDRDVRVADQLRASLGARSVAAVAGESSATAVTGYIAVTLSILDHARTSSPGTYAPAALPKRLFAAPWLIQACLEGRNARLNEEAPARLIADDRSDRDALIAAATLVSA